MPWTCNKVGSSTPSNASSSACLLDCLLARLLPSCLFVQVPSFEPVCPTLSDSLLVSALRGIVMTDLLRGNWRLRLEGSGQPTLSLCKCTQPGTCCKTLLPVRRGFLPTPTPCLDVIASFWDTPEQATLSRATPPYMTCHGILVRSVDNTMREQRLGVQ